MQPQNGQNNPNPNNYAQNQNPQNYSGYPQNPQNGQNPQYSGQNYPQNPYNHLQNQAPVQNIQPPHINQEFTNTVPMEYLNQISDPVNNKPTFGKFQIIGLASLLAVGLILLILTMGSQNNAVNPSKNLLLIQARLETLKEISEDEHDLLRDTELRKINGSFGITAQTVLQEIEAPIEATNSTTVPLTSVEIADEKAYMEALLEEYNEARLNVELDKVYSRQMGYELTNLRGLMQSTYSSTNNQDIKSYLESADENLSAVHEQFEEFSSVK